eukprot:TRINITY_DN897_c0_g1_i2.p1 TRINITY_DN897_c0_g1~~TRINITY_DN897_c0_g1_i2.p1  ORF type:complete len:596 (+),score=142.58 TRINITY_DN897_c0_g1_i2:176-1963(+)
MRRAQTSSSPMSLSCSSRTASRISLRRALRSEIREAVRLEHERLIGLLDVWALRIEGSAAAAAARERSDTSARCFQTSPSCSPEAAAATPDASPRRLLQGASEFSSRSPSPRQASPVFPKRENMPVVSLGRELEVSHAEQQLKRRRTSSFLGNESALTRWCPWLSRCELAIARAARAPEDVSGCAARVVKSKLFEAGSVLVILLHGAFTGYVTDYQMQNMSSGQTWFIWAAECGFLCFYTIELLLKLISQRLSFFLGEEWRWNVFDFLLVVFAAVDVGIGMLVLLGKLGSDGNLNLAWLRMFRILRLPRVLRLFRLVHYFPDLKLMLYCICGSFFVLFWCLATIFLVIYIFALILVQRMTTHLEDSAGELDAVQLRQIQDLFGSVLLTMKVLFECVSGGNDWGNVLTVVDYTGPVNSAIFLMFVSSFIIVIWNIVTSTFVEKAFKLAQPDIDALLIEKRQKDLTDAKELIDIFHEIDTDGSRGIGWEEFEHLATTSKMGTFLEVRGIEIKDAKTMFKMLCSLSDGSEVDLKSFVNGCIRMKGLATSIDLHSLSFQEKLFQRNMKHMMCDVDSRLLRIESMLKKKATHESDDAEFI